MAEGVGGIVGGQSVVVEADRAAPAHHPAPAGLEAESDLSGDMTLGLDEEGVQGLLERALVRVLSPVLAFCAPGRSARPPEKVVLRPRRCGAAGSAADL